MDFRVQRFHAPVHHLRKARDRRHLGGHYACFGQRAVCAAGRQEFDVKLGQCASEFGNAGFVGHADDAPPDLAQKIRHHSTDSW